MAETDCADYGASAKTDVAFNNHQTLREAFRESRRTLRPLGKIERFVVIPLVPAMMAATIVLFTALKILTSKDGRLLFSIVAAVVGFLTIRLDRELGDELRYRVNKPAEMLNAVCV